MNKKIGFWRWMFNLVIMGVYRCLKKNYAMRYLTYASIIWAVIWFVFIPDDLLPYGAIAMFFSLLLVLSYGIYKDENPDGVV